jgi:hypothetical protein
MNRGELGLAYLGFDSSFDVLLQNNASNERIKV